MVGRQDRPRPHDASSEVIERVGIGRVADERVDALPTGQARLVELGRALATQPKVLLLDEPASGLDDAETERVRRAAASSWPTTGMAVLLVEHDMALVMQRVRHDPRARLRRA